MKAYKKDQGRMARMAAFWSLSFLLLFGCTTLHTVLAAQFASLREPMGGLVIPIVAIDVNGAFLITGTLFVVGVITNYRWQQRPKVADLLIETENELRKVTWPTMQQVINSSAVVIVCVLILMGYLAGADFVLGKVVARLLLGGS